MTDLPKEPARRVTSMNLNGLTTVATPGFGDIPPKPFAALSLIATPGWLAFNVKENFSYERNDSGVCAPGQGVIDDATMRLNAAVHPDKRSPRSIASESLRQQGLVL